MKRILSVITIALSANTLNAQTQYPVTPSAISLATENVAYMQNFPRIANGATEGGLNATNGTFNGLPQGWSFSELGSSSNVDGAYRSGPGNSTVLDVYSFGESNSSSDRALGSLTGVVLPNIKMGVVFTNNTGAPITKLLISYVGEQWRQGGSGIAGKLNFAYSTNANSLNSGTWTAVTALDFTAPQTGTTAVELNGNTAGNRISISNVITGLNIAAGGNLWLRWENANVSGGNTDDGLAIDDFSITPNPSTQPVDLTLFDYQKSGNSIQLKWETASEKNNSHFEIFRSSDGLNFTRIAKIEGNGNADTRNSYRYTDFDPLGGLSYYQLKQVDYNGDFKIYPVLSVKFNDKQLDFNVHSQEENAALVRIYSPESIKSVIRVTDMNAREVVNQNIILEKGYNEVKLNLAAAKGVYVATLSSGTTALKKKFISK